MTFAAPLWLAALLPWAAVSLWLLSGRGQPATVPFLPLWKVRAATFSLAARAVRRPPGWVLCLQAAMAMAIVAAAGPQWRGLRQGSRSRAGEGGIAIVGVGARAAPTPQVMIRLRNDSDRSEATVRLNLGDTSMERRIDLPPRGGERNYFLNPPALGPLVRVTVVDSVRSAANPADGAATLVRQPLWPRLAAGGAAPLPAAVRRMMDVYSAVRPASDSGAVALVSADALPADVDGVRVLSPAPGWEPALDSNAIVTVAPHPIVANVRRWPGAAAAAAAPPPEMRVIVSRSGIPLVAAGEVDRRRHVWVNLALSGWDQTADFVVFFTNVFDWLGGPGGGEGDAYIAQLPISTGPVPTAGSGVESYRNRSARPRQGWAVLAAAAFSVAAVVVWPENRLQK